MNEARRTNLIVPVLLLICLISGGASAQAVDGRMVLKRMLSSEGIVAFTAHQVTTLSRGPSLTSEQIVYRDGFRGMRTEYTSPPALAGEIMVDNGSTLIHFVPRNKVAKTRPSRLIVLRQRTMEAGRAFQKGQLRAELVGKDKIAGRSAYVLQVEPVAKREGQTRKFWVDTEKWIKLKTEDIGPDGAVLSTSYYTKIEFVGKFPPRRFHFDPPSGVRVERGQDRPKVMSLDQARRMVGFKALEPAYLPKGFKAVGAAVTPFRKGKILVLRYSDGVTTFSLFQAPGRMLDSRFLEKLQEGPKRSGKGAYSWRRGDLNLTLIGPIPPDEVRKIADSVK